MIPQDLPAERTLLLVAFRREQQKSIDSWIHGLKLHSSDNQIPWIEIPLIQRRWKLLSSWIGYGMRCGISDNELRAHVWTAYTNRSSFLKRMRLTRIDCVYSFVVSKDGRVLALVSGDYNSDAAQLILKALC